MSSLIAQAITDAGTDLTSVLRNIEQALTAIESAVHQYATSPLRIAFETLGDIGITADDWQQPEELNASWDALLQLNEHEPAEYLSLLSLMFAGSVCNGQCHPYVARMLEATWAGLYWYCATKHGVTIAPFAPNSPMRLELNELQVKIRNLITTPPEELETIADAQ